MSNTHPVFAGIISLHFPALARDAEADRARAISAEVQYMFGEYDGDPAPVRERITFDPDAVAAAKLFNRQQRG